MSKFGNKTNGDVLENSIPQNIQTKTDLYLNKLYTWINDNRDVLGYPKNSDSIPYLFVTNDLPGKYFQALNLFIQKKVQFDVPTCLDVLKSLIDTYDEHPEDSDRCCAFYFSKTKEEMQTLLGKLELS